MSSWQEIVLDNVIGTGTLIRHVSCLPARVGLAGTIQTPVCVDQDSLSDKNVRERPVSG